MSIREGFNEMWKTLKTGKGYEQRLREDRRAYEKAKERERKKRELESKRKSLQSEIKRKQKNQENKKNYTIETNPGGRKMKVIRIENKDGTTTIRKTPIYDDNTKTDTKKQTKTISPRGGKIDDMSFGEAFKSSKSAGKKEFTWRGNKYHTRTKEEEAKKYEDGGTNDVQRHQAPSFSSMFDVGSKMKLFGGGPASERAKMRHERKMARQGAKADRKMVRTEGRQERRADRLAGRQESSSRRQDRKDQRQDSRLGYYEKGGKTPRIKKKDRPKGAELDELMYKQQYGENYADDPNMEREKEKGILSEIQSTPKKYHTQDTKTKAGQFISKLVGAKEYYPNPNKKRKYKEDRTQAYRKKTRKKKNILGKTIIYGDTLYRQDKRSADDKGGSVHTSGPGSRTKSYDIVDRDGNKKRVYFKTQEEADRYFANIDKDTGQPKTLGEKQDFEKITPYTVKDSEGKEKEGEFKSTVEAHGSTELKDIKDEDKRGKTEKEIRESARTAPKTGITSEHSALDFSDQSTTNLRNPSKYSDKKTKYVFDPAKGTVVEKVKRRSGIGYKKTGREKDIEGYQELADEKRQQREEEKANKPSGKEKRQQKKENREKKREEKAKQAEVARKAREEGKSSYIYNGTTYNIAPKVMKGGGTLMEQYNRKYSNGGIDPEKKDNTRVHTPERKIKKSRLGNFFRGKQKQIQIERRPNPKKVYRKEGRKHKEILIGGGDDPLHNFGTTLPGGKSNMEVKPNWNKKLSKLNKKREEQREGGKSTKRTQRRINREYRKINPRYNTGGVNMDEDNDGLPIGIDATPGGTMQGPTMPPNNNQMSISGNNLGTITDPLANDEPEPDNLFEEDVNTGGNNINSQNEDTNQGDMNQQDDSMDQGQDPAGPTRAQLRHERKSARQQARADRRMVRTEARQQRKADRLAGRMEKRGRRQDRKDQRQEARISKREDRRSERQSRKFDRQQNRNMRRRNRRGNFKHGGMVKGKKGAGLGIIIVVGRKSNKKGK